jgi:uncharacterized protein (DUF433 family)
MDWSDCQVVEIIPGKVSGAPLVRGSRVQADTVLESHQLGESVDEIAYSYDLNPEVIRALLTYAAAHELTKADG